jgi:hypothetical protein
MARNNIFEILEAKWDLPAELRRLLNLFEEEKIIEYGANNYYTVRNFVDWYCFEDWKNRGRYYDMDDYFTAIDYDVLIENANTDVGDFLTVAEIIYNCYYMVASRIEIEDDKELQLLKMNLDCCLEHYNNKAYYYEDKEQAIVAEIDVAATAVAEISNPETAYQIIQYNHHALKNDIAMKKRILLHLALELEPKRTKLKEINRAYESDIFYLLNNLNLRHNNCDSATKNFKQYVADMTKEILEEWYDGLYQMILLAMLEIDNLARTEKVAELKTHLAK